MSLERIELIVDALLTEATERYGKTADMPPSVFAIGRRRVMVAVARDDLGRRVTLETATGLLSLMSRHVRAVYLGRVDSGFIQSDDDLTEPIEQMEPGDIARNADTDPTISTVLLCEAYDSETDTSVLHVARLTLDEDGAPYWERLATTAPESVISRSLQVAHISSQFLSGRLRYRHLRKIAKNIHWSISRRSSQIGRVAIPGASDD